MKTCPNCQELIGDSVETCFKCNYSFKYKRVIDKKNPQQEDKIKQEDKDLQISKNPFYEYRVVVVNNLENGAFDQNGVQKTLSEWSGAGWKLHSIFNNELGKTSSSMAVPFMGVSVNATIDQTVLIFERCIKA